MKKYLSLIVGSFIILFMFAAPGSSVKAAEKQVSSDSESALQIYNPGAEAAMAAAPQEDCGCHNVTPILGAERNKMVADLISSDEFKNVKMQAKQMGYKWLGANPIEIIKFNADGRILAGVPFSQDGIVQMFVFIDGTFAGVSPM